MPKPIEPAIVVTLVIAPAHMRSIAKPGTVWGSPARIAPVRPRVRPWSPCCVVAAMATYLPWFTQTDRPLFFFYAITIVPFTCIGLAMALGLVIGRTATRVSEAEALDYLQGYVILNDVSEPHASVYRPAIRHKNSSPTTGNDHYATHNGGSKSPAHGARSTGRGIRGRGRGGSGVGRGHGASTWGGRVWVRVRSKFQPERGPRALICSGRGICDRSTLKRNCTW